MLLVFFRFLSVLDINRYKEDGLLLELSRVFPYTIQYCRGHLTSLATSINLKSHDCHVTRSSSRIAGPASADDLESVNIQSFMDAFEENGHHQLAFSIGIKVL